MYFIVKKVKEYGKLSGQTLDQMVAGARVEPGEDKEDPMDFALWKAAKPDEISWESPWGKGRPGWHIECSAMCLKHIGMTVDIHGGGTDLVFPHHENEILQSEAYNDVTFVRYWMHNGMLTIDNEKMSKSLKNFFSINDILEEYPPEVVRFFILNASYRAPLDYDEKSLEETRKALEKLQNAYDAMRRDDARNGDRGREGPVLARPRGSSRSGWTTTSQPARRSPSCSTSPAKRTGSLSEGRLSREGAENIVSVLDRFNGLFDVLIRERQGFVTVSDRTGLKDEVQAGTTELNLETVTQRGTRGR